MNRFDLIKPTNNSPLCYKNFYHLFYLTTLTDKLFTSYITTGTEYIRRITHNYNLTEADDIHEFLKEIAQDIYTSYHRNEELLCCMGLAPSKDRDIKSNLPDINNVIQESFSQVGNAHNYFDIIKNFLNTREFQMLYGFIESATNDLINEYFNKNKHLDKNEFHEKNQYENFLFKAEILGLVKLDEYTKSAWEFYIQIRNLYAHQYGFITNKHIKKLFHYDKKKNRHIYNNFIERLNYEFRFAPNNIDIMNNVFQKENFHINKLYLLNDLETLIFRDIAIDIMESINAEYLKTHQVQP